MSSFRTKILILALAGLLTSLACSLPYGLGLDQNQSPAGGQIISQATTQSTPTWTPTATPTATPTWTPTNTPEPTPTSTRVVLATNTPDPRFATPTATPIRSLFGVQLIADDVDEAASTEVIIDPDTGEVITQTQTVQTIVVPLPTASGANVIVNGDFEADWEEKDGVAPGWKTFDNGGAYFGWHRERWDDVVLTGHQSQLIAVINNTAEEDKFAGIYQTVDVVAGAEYELTIYGLIRSDEGSNEASGYGYLMQYGIDFQGGEQWERVSDWITMPFPEYPREDPTGANEYPFKGYTVRVIPSGNQLTLFIRGVSKWPDYNEGNFDVDNVSLRGTGAQRTTVRTVTTSSAVADSDDPGASAPETMPITGGDHR